MTWLVERLASLRLYLDHAKAIRSRVTGPESLARDLSLRNDVVFSLLSISQLVIDIASELAGRRGERFEDYTEAIRTLAGDPRFSPSLVDALSRLPGFRNVVVHEYVSLDLGKVIEAMDHLNPVEEFLAIVRGIEESD
jgi:uncharacterized protein YutE (UPF0331/DUF86 family)